MSVHIYLARAGLPTTFVVNRQFRAPHTGMPRPAITAGTPNQRTGLHPGVSESIQLLSGGNSVSDGIRIQQNGLFQDFSYTRGINQPLAALRGIFANPISTLALLGSGAVTLLATDNNYLGIGLIGLGIWSGKTLYNILKEMGRYNIELVTQARRLAEDEAKEYGTGHHILTAEVKSMGVHEAAQRLIEIGEKYPFLSARILNDVGADYMPPVELMYQANKNVSIFIGPERTALIRELDIRQDRTSAAVLARYLAYTGIVSQPIYQQLITNPTTKQLLLMELASIDPAKAYILNRSK